MADEPKLAVALDDDVAQGIYSNLVFINHTDGEFTLDFAYAQPGGMRAKIRTRIVSAPRHTKRLLYALKKNIERYEAKFGTIDVPDDGPSVH